MGHAQGLGRCGSWGLLSLFSSRDWELTGNLRLGQIPELPAHPQPPADNTKVTTRRFCRCFNLWHFIPHQRLSRRHEYERWMRKPCLAALKVTIVCIATWHSCCSTSHPRSKLWVFENKNRIKRPRRQTLLTTALGKTSFDWRSPGKTWKWEEGERKIVTQDDKQTNLFACWLRRISCYLDAT